MSTKPDPATVSAESPKGRERIARIHTRIDFLGTCDGYIAKAEASALRWALARLDFLENRAPKISQAAAADIIEAWRVDSVEDHNGRPVLDGLDLDALGIG
jgi:hypothetical protein